MDKTIAEKIFSSHTGADVYADDIVVVEPDLAFAQDGTALLAIEAFKKLNVGGVKYPQRLSFFIDHNAPASFEGVANLHKLMREFAKAHNIRLFDVGEGICHQLMIESGKLVPGNIVVGADSHTPTYGPFNLLSIGVGSTELGVIMATGKLWFRVPQSIKITLSGYLQPHTSAKDIALYLLGKLGANFANYKCIEFHDKIGLTLSDRFTISNLAVELGAKCTTFLPDGMLYAYLGTEGMDYVYPDDDAIYSEILEFDLSELPPQIAQPHSPNAVVAVEDCEGEHIDEVVIGTCTNGRLVDFEIAARILKGNKVATRLLIVPGSRKVYLDALKAGLIEVFIESGGIILPPGCGPCVGTHCGIPADGEVVLSTGNRNFKGRMGNANAAIYLCSPATAAASAIVGKITSPSIVVS